MSYSTFPQIERRQQETLAACTTDEQRATVERLHALDKCAYTYKRQGRGVVAEFRRYCRDYDAAKIGAGLYDWSIMGSGGLNDIAHYDIHGFRSVYPHPAIYLERLLYPEVDRWHHDAREEPNGFHSQGVYTDGMTKGEVARDILLIADSERARVQYDYNARATAAARAEAERLADSLGLQLVPK